MNGYFQSDVPVPADARKYETGSISGAASSEAIYRSRTAGASEQFAENAKSSADLSAQIGGDPMTVMAILGRAYERLCTIESATGRLAGRIGDGQGSPDVFHDGFEGDLAGLARSVDNKAREIEANVARCNAALG